MSALTLDHTLHLPGDLILQVGGQELFGGQYEQTLHCGHVSIYRATYNNGMSLQKCPFIYVQLTLQKSYKLKSIIQLLTLPQFFRCNV